MGEPNAVLAAIERLSKQAMVDGALDKQFNQSKADLTEAYLKEKESGEHPDDLNAMLNSIRKELATLHIAQTLQAAMTKTVLGILFDAMPAESQFTAAAELSRLKLEDILPEE
jgi:hypothetical protein